MGSAYLAFALIGLIVGPAPAAAATPSPGVSAVVLGIAQDGGVPHLGCEQERCHRARADPSQRLRVASLGVVDEVAGKRFLIDATPDFASQVESLGGRPDGILLTHAHIGHYLGLAQLGREVLGAKRLPVYATPAMAAFLRASKPWSRLVERENIEIREVEPGKRVALTPRLSATAIKVPHRDEDSDTVAWMLEGPAGSVLWLPDIDRWEKWDRSLEELASDPKRTLFLDGTFYFADEIPGRSIADIPHPLVPDTAARLGRPAAKVFFVHFNHTNRLLWDEEAQRALTGRGFGIAREGQRMAF
jgi:pyrroloquinoline quinone biosynthesis protein B